MGWSLHWHHTFCQSQWSGVHQQTSFLSVAPLKQNNHFTRTLSCLIGYHFSSDSQHLVSYEDILVAFFAGNLTLPYIVMSFIFHFCNKFFFSFSFSLFWFPAIFWGITFTILFDLAVYNSIHLLYTVSSTTTIFDIFFLQGLIMFKFQNGLLISKKYVCTVFQDPEILWYLHLCPPFYIIRDVSRAISQFHFKFMSGILVNTSSLCSIVISFVP